MAVFQDLPAAFAVRTTRKERGPAPAVAPDVVPQAFPALLKKLPPPPPGAPASGA